MTCRTAINPYALGNYIARKTPAEIHDEFSHGDYVPPEKLPQQQGRDYVPETAPYVTQYRERLVRF